MWVAQTEELDSGHILRIRILLDGKSLSYDQILNGWRSDGAFRELIIHVTLKDQPVDEESEVIEGKLERRWTFDYEAQSFDVYEEQLG